MYVLYFTNVQCTLHAVGGHNKLIANLQCSPLIVDRSNRVS